MLAFDAVAKLPLAAQRQTAAAGGQVAVTLDALTLSATALLDIGASANITLGSLTLSATATLDLTGSAGISLAPLTLASAGGLQIQGALSVTLDGLTMAATGSLAASGATTIQLEDLSLTATGQFPPIEISRDFVVYRALDRDVIATLESGPYSFVVQQPQPVHVIARREKDRAFVTSKRPTPTITVHQ